MGRLAQCLIDLDWLSEASRCLEEFKSRHPEHIKSVAFTQREIDLNSAKDKKMKNSQKLGTGSRVESASEPVNPALSQYPAANFLRSENQDGEPMDSDDSEEEAVNYSSDPERKSLSNQEVQFRAKARDYSDRYLGACNTTTDIKEANFLGSDGQFIMAGSDDGKFFIWDRKSTNIVKVLVGDDNIVNCLQSHPSAPVLATSGIDPVVRIWQPRAEDGEEDKRIVEDLDGAASSNQRRMNADPFETILLNMGYRINPEEEEETDVEDGSVQC